MSDTKEKKMTLKALAPALMAIALALLAPAPAQAQFGISEFGVRATNEDGTPATQAGSHPFAFTTSFMMNSTPGKSPSQPPEPDADLKDLVVEQMRGFAGDATAMPQCSNRDFATPREGTQMIDGITSCSDETAVGIASVWVNNIKISAPVFNLPPPAGVPVRLGTQISLVPVIVDVGVNPTPPYDVTGTSRDTSQLLAFLGGKLQLWGNPADPAHDDVRGICANSLKSFTEVEGLLPFGNGGQAASCPTKVPNKPFLTLPTSCGGPLATVTHWSMSSWQEPGKFIFGGVPAIDDSEPPSPIGMSGCGKLGFSPTIESKPTTDSAESGSGLDFNVDFKDEGLKNPGGLAESQIEKAEVTLPEGVTINPSIGEGLGVCTPADLRRETLESAPGEGCPNSSKIGTIHAVFPAVEEPVDGSIYLAQEDDKATTTPGAENPFDSLIALYLVLKNPNLGALAKLPVRLEPDPQTGQLVATLEENPQIPFSHFNAHLRTGARAALITPSRCGTYTTQARLYPWSDPANPRTVTSSFQITKGVGGGPCPPGGVPPFHPKFEAGSLNNNAGSFSPFNMRLIREDGEQDMTKFSAVLPPGEVGSLVGVSKCPDAAIDVAKSKTGRQEIASPSCPANSLIGHTLAGAGVGDSLTYVKGQIYLGGAYHGDPLSVISVTPAVAGPFDAGTVVVRLALTLNPKTAEVEVDGAASDPIPHILDGIVLKVRDLRVYVDRPNFLLNPTSCDESSARATLFGSYLNVLDPADDRPVDLSTRYQAANCLNLGFKPDLKLNLHGGTKRGGHPSLTATYTPRAGDANIKGLVVRLPRSAFLDQAHIRTICTRVQFAAKACPPGAQYGYIKAWTPLLEEPLQGPVYLRSSDHKLPDLVFDLHGLVDVEVSTRIDSAKGGIRATLENSPDAPLSKVVLQMQGAKKGLIVNSTDLCTRPHRANLHLSAHNGKELSTDPSVRAQCGRRR